MAMFGTEFKVILQGQSVSGDRSKSADGQSKGQKSLVHAIRNLTVAARSLERFYFATCIEKRFVAPAKNAQFSICTTDDAQIGRKGPHQVRVDVHRHCRQQNRELSGRRIYRTSNLSRP